MKNFIENLYFISEAYKMGLGNDRNIKKQINSISDFMMVQKYGYLWQETTSPLIDEYIKITESKLEKRSKLFYYNYIKCDNIDSLSVILGNLGEDITINEYNALKSRVSHDSFLTYGNTIIQWPFGALFDFKDILYKQNTGLISKPLMVNNIVYFFYLDSIGICQVSETDKKVLQQELKTFKEIEMDRRKTIEMDSLSKVILFEDNINQLADYIGNNKELGQFPENIVLLKYFINENEKFIDYKEFYRYEKGLPFKTPIKTKSKLVEEIKQYFYDDYLKEEAKKLGLYNSKKFLLDRKNYKNKLVLSQFLKNEIESKIEIDSLVIVDYYNRNLNKINIPKAIIADLYYFNDKSSAEIGINEMSKFDDGLNNYSTISTSFNGLIAIERNVTINNKYLPLSKEIYHSLETLDRNTTFRHIIPTRDKFVVLLKKDTQLYTVQKLDNNLYLEIYKSLHQKKFQELRTSLLNELTKKYKIKKNKVPDIS